MGDNDTPYMCRKYVRLTIKGSDNCGDWAASCLLLDSVTFTVKTTVSGPAGSGRDNDVDCCVGHCALHMCIALVVIVVYKRTTRDDW